MCYNCGCHNLEDDMGNKDNITEDTFKHLSKHWGTSVEETKKKVLAMLSENKITDSHIEEMFEKASKAWGQSVDQAKQKTKNILEDQIQSR